LGRSAAVFSHLGVHSTSLRAALDQAALVFHRPRGPLTPAPRPIYCAELGVFIRPQPAEFVEHPSSGGSQWDAVFTLPPAE